MDADECLDEQNDEIEALQSLYLEDELKITAPVGSDKPSFELLLFPLPGEGDKNHVGIKLVVTYPALYPEEVPGIEVESIKGLNPEQIRDLVSTLKDLAEEEVGMSMVFTLAEAAKEWMQERNEKSKGDGSAFERMNQRKREKERVEKKVKDIAAAKAFRKAEAEEDTSTKHVLIPITKDGFLKWRDDFEAEMEANKKLVVEVEAVVVGPTTFSGRKIFELGIQGGGFLLKDALAAELAKEAASNSSTKAEVAIDEGLFLDEMDSFMDDFDGLDLETEAATLPPIPPQGTSS